MAKIDELKFDDKNFNKHTQQGMGLLEKSLREFGAGRSILIDKNNNIIGGNGVVEVAGQIGINDVQIVESDGTKIVAVKRTDIDLHTKKGRKLALADNATAKVDIEWDEENMRSELSDDEIAEWVDEDWNDEPNEVVEDEAPEIDESEPAKSELGKVYQLGEHRLMCGDSTDAGSVAILMNGQKVDMVFTDPPYGMNLDTDYSVMTHRQQTLGVNKSNKFEKVKGDNDDFSSDLIDTIFNNFGYCKEIFVWGADYYAELVPYRNNGNFIVWDKTCGDVNLGKMFGSNFELCWTKNKHKRVVINDVKYKGVFGMEKDDLNKRVHPTQKPSTLAQWFLKKYGKEGDLVVDIYGGSGSTLIACEQLGRKCYMMELDPKYCDVIRKRYWKFTHDGDETGWEEGTKAI